MQTLYHTACSSQLPRDVGYFSNGSPFIISDICPSCGDVIEEVSTISPTPTRTHTYRIRHPRTDS